MSIRLDGFSGRVAIVTGSSEGIGFSIAKALAENGANILLVARREGLLRQAAETLGPAAAWISADLTEEGAAQKIVEKAVSTFGGIDFLVNNAGVNRLGLLGETVPSDMRQMMELNLIAPYLMTQAALPHLAARPGAAILNVSTAGSRKPTPGEGFYCATKAGLNYLTNLWAIELADRGIRVNAIAPSGMDTPQFNKVAATIEGAREMVANLHLIKRIGNPEELIGAVLLLLSPVAGSFMTGAIVDVDGGYHVT
ncbi:MAG TPA: SDR family oxidoreductase [Allosphingosinicella sp.]|nr:SDR family oxidoreductase [Allosphingosinicella sp.]